MTQAAFSVSWISQSHEDDTIANPRCVVVGRGVYTGMARQEVYDDAQ